MADAHGKAIDYDLLTLTDYRLADLGGRLDWHTFEVFLSGLPLSSAFQRSKNPDLAIWTDGSVSALILADIFDQIGSLRYEIARSKGAKVNKPKAYPRPFGRSEEGATEHFGSDPIPVSEFDDWWNSCQSTN